MSSQRPFASAAKLIAGTARSGAYRWCARSLTKEARHDFSPTLRLARAVPRGHGRAVIAALLVLVSATPAAAGAPPNRLDDNRGNFLIQTTVNSFVSLPPLLPFFFPFPFLLPPPFGPLSPRVLENPEIFNVYWDDDWNDHHSGAFSTDGIDDMTKKLVQSNYFGFAGQYDVGQPRSRSNTSGGLLNPCPTHLER